MSFEGFYPSVSATFRHIEQRYGYEALERYWRQLAEEYYAPVIERFEREGLGAVADHFRAYFAKEPEAQVSVTTAPGRVDIEVRQCPAFYWLKHFKCAIPQYYCRHCEVINGVFAGKSGMRFELQGGQGLCRQSFIVEELS